ncbi:uveal autoantigen with coiled-coil domains and ankyrin repeats protein-like [Hydractinia symbiolongicarpus]|uniref:uveal autoantigen with coiled-coil domains and ankyrin repeats protein-like n=1 Tax=Hydractinia symbiolongicarpus TaxID=13093 RepID=UPI00254EC6E0|nr:uveal autoantigen with coiled-coil domains and ankyrin repeats protein-like [Hydractinia symbiolongicarpus]
MLYVSKQCFYISSFINVQERKVYVDNTMSASAEVATVEKLERNNSSLKPEVNTIDTSPIDLKNDKLYKKDLENGIHNTAARINGVNVDDMSQIKNLEKDVSEVDEFINGNTNKEKAPEEVKDSAMENKYDNHEIPTEEETLKETKTPKELVSPEEEKIHQEAETPKEEKTHKEELTTEEEVMPKETKTPVEDVTPKEVDIHNEVEPPKENETCKQVSPVEKSKEKEKLKEEEAKELENKLLNEDSSDAGTESVLDEDNLLNSDDDTLMIAEQDEKPQEDKKCTSFEPDLSCQDKAVDSPCTKGKAELKHENDGIKIEGIESKEESDKAICEPSVENVSKSARHEQESEVSKPENGLDKTVKTEEKMDVDEDKAIADVNDENELPMEIIPSPEPVEVSKKKRISEQKSKIERLKEDLRCEETTLTLLRKLLESQRGKSLYKSSSKHGNVVPSLHPKPQQIAPKNLSSSKPSSLQSTKASSNASQPVQKYYIQVGNQLVPAPPPGTPGSGPVYQYANGTSNSHSSYQSQPLSKPLPPPKQTPEQKQDAAKAALRRQLEQTLLQIPPPRPPPADWKAIPNVNSMDFMMLVGLDEVVDTILDMDFKPTLKTALEELTPYNPRICSQCTVDFSPCWKTKEGDVKGFVLCERCALQNVKKELKAEHTSRLKSAFLKALKQEQEIEEKIKAGEDVNIGNLTGNEKSDRGVQSPQQSSSHASSPQPPTSVQQTGSHAPTPTERHHQSSSHHHRHQVVQHYPHPQSLVQQLHHQHIQQQQLEMEPSSRHSSRWHPYIPPSSHHHRDHHPVHHRPYASSSSSVGEGSPHQEYYVVHHPQHAGVRYLNR